MIINIHAGHNPDGKPGSGAIGLIKESTEARNVKNRVIGLLRSAGHTVYDCTVENGTSQNDVLQKIVAKCNAHKVDLDVSIHFNSGRNDMSGDGSNGGTEVYIYSKPGAAYDAAVRICERISRIGFKNRGVKEDKSLYVLQKTSAQALLVECCFVDDADDIKLYNADSMAQAIAEGIVDQTIAGSGAQPLPTPSTSSGPSYQVGKIYTLQVELKVRTGPGTNYRAKSYAELTADAKSSDSDRDGAIGKGTSVTCKEVQKNGNDIWIRIPSGWIAAYYEGNIYVK